MLNQMMSNGSGWMGLWMGTGMAVLVVLVISGIVLLAKTLFNSPQPSVEPTGKTGEIETGDLAHTTR
jgi:hypothetical protein